MELIFVGTSSGRTSLNRFHSSFLLKSESENILIDTGDGISKALMNQNIDFNSITDIILSHYHSDHLAGLPSLLTQMIIKNRTVPLNIFTHSKLLVPLNSFLEICYIFLDKTPFNINLVGFDFSDKIAVTDSLSLTAKQNSHVTNKHNILDTKINFISMSFLFELTGKKIIYTSDISAPEDLYLFQESKGGIFITEATHLPYSKLEDIISINSPDKIFLTHIDNEKELYDWYYKLPLNKKEKFIIASEGMTISL